MSADVWRHSLSFVVRFNNHFTGAPVATELPVRLEGSLVRPVAQRGGTERRHADGTYRYIDLRSGVHRVRWLPPFTRSYGGWISWEGLPEVTVPSAHPEDPIERDLWPAASAYVPPAMTAVRGKLSGTGVAGLEVRIDVPAGPWLHFTRSDDSGEFLYLLPHPIVPDAQGRLALRIEVERGARAVNGGEFRPAAAGSSFPASDFRVRPGVCSRIVFHVA